MLSFYANSIVDATIRIANWHFITRDWFCTCGFVLTCNLHEGVSPRGCSSENELWKGWEATLYFGFRALEWKKCAGARLVLGPLISCKKLPIKSFINFSLLYLENDWIFYIITTCQWS